MQCRQCGYRLWHLTTRLCPECGTPFRPSEYAFVPNTVEFCCPHCGQAYFGTDSQGLLDPRAFDCVSCGRHIHMDQMVLRPAEGIDERQTQPEHIPWLQRDKLSLGRAWWGTVKMAMTAPTRLMQLLPMDARLEDGLWFSAMTFLVSMSLMWVIWILLMLGMLLSGGRRATAVILPVFCGMGLLAPFLAILGMLIWATAAHIVLRITGRTAGTWGRTLQAFCYSSGSYAIGAVPCLGMYVAPIWWLISAILAVREGQKVHGGRAAFAVIALPVTIFMLVIGLQATMFYAAATYTPSVATHVVDADTDTRSVLEGLLKFANAHQGRWPVHALSLAAEDYVPAYDFVGTHTLTSIDEVPVAETTLEQFITKSEAIKRKLVEMAARQIPPNVSAHRLGDFVFTYHGIDRRHADGRLWVVVFAPETSNVTAGYGVLVAGCVDGTTTSVSGPRYGQQLCSLFLKKQNELRARYGLPPLPDPRTVTHTQPAVASPTSSPS